MIGFPASNELIAFTATLVILFVGIRALFRLEPVLGTLLESFFSVVFNYIRFPRKLIDPSIKVLPGLRQFSFRRILHRFKFTSFILFLNVYTFIFTVDMESGQINPAILESRGFSYLHFAQHKWFILVTSNFIHFHWLHLAVNMIMLVIFSGALELLVGGRFAAIVYLIAMNSDVPNGLFLLPGLRVLYPAMWAETVQYVDVGASLGIIGSLGGLARLLVPKARFALLGTAIAGAIVGSVYIQNLFGIDHAFSALIGYIVAGLLLERETKHKNQAERLNVGRI